MSHAVRFLVTSLILAITLVAFNVSPASAADRKRESIQLAADPSLSPDGKTLVFSWKGDIWSVPSSGGMARQLTRHPAYERQPSFSPNGKEIAFTSKREDGSWQVYVMPAEGGIPEQLTYHSEGNSLLGWYPDGKSLLTTAVRDHSDLEPTRFYRVNRQANKRQQLLFDSYASEGMISPDGKRVLFTREGSSPYRKGYTGARASQIWIYDLESKQFTWVHPESEVERRYPLWMPNGEGFYYVGQESGNFNLWQHDLKSGEEKQLTFYDDDAVLFPTLSQDGSTLVFRRLFDFYVFRPGKDKEPKRIDIWNEADSLRSNTERHRVNQAAAAGFTKDGLEIALVADNDLWVMDTVLREPHQITRTAAEEREPLFTPDNNTILFIRDDGHGRNLCVAKRKDAGKAWWENTEFSVDQITQHGLVNGNLSISPDGKKIAYLCGAGDLWIADVNGENAYRRIASPSPVEYDWSPDSKWLAYSQENQDFDRDVFICSVAQSDQPPYNLSRFPYFEGKPAWSPDGKVIAFVNQSNEHRAELCYVWLSEHEEEENTDARARKIKEARELIAKARPKKEEPKKEEPKKEGEEQKKEPEPAKPQDAKPDDAQKKPNTRLFMTAEEKPGEPDPKKDEPKKEEPKKDESPKKDEPKKDEAKKDGPNGDKKNEAKPAEGVKEIKIEFETLHERIQRRAINGNIGELFWAPNSKALAFTGTVDGRPGLYAFDLPEFKSPPRFIVPNQGSNVTWLQAEDQIVWLENGVPARIKGNQQTSFPFEIQNEINLTEKYRVAFGIGWRFIRDFYYDGRFGNRDWEAIYKKYEDQAARSVEIAGFARVMELMLGELNASHLGFSPRAQEWNPGQAWNEQTAHLGVRFDDTDTAAGLLVRDILPKGPADKETIKIVPGDRITHIDGVELTEGMDPYTLLNGTLNRDIRLTVLSSKDAPTTGTASDKKDESSEKKPPRKREVVIRPIAYGAARDLVKDKWIRDNEKTIDKLSNGALGYLHINAMSGDDLVRFEREVYEKTVNKQGLVIDVRNNPGGYVADKLLQMLCPPHHAYTRRRNDTEAGYLQAYPGVLWMRKPVVVLCNQNSGSNAEIFCHAIKNLNRGKLVGVKTHGAVIGTQEWNIMDVGGFRVPNIGFYTARDGEDMELHGAEPNFVVWPQPTELASGKDRQIEKAVEVLLQDVAERQKQPKPKLIKATERPTAYPKPTADPEPAKP
ncbi:MAG TPA: S41 family peptidase [Candidatus Sumerlaeota bacterium]|nr:S41 family peptidase [Candidatus Sumerlaeota bacterium]HPS00386.1 S41 family peptidase [Candidatus Sumerlaeota bacterium]